MDKAKEKTVLWQVLLVAAAFCGQSARDAVASHQTAALIHGISLLNAPDPDLVYLTRPPGRYRGGGAPGMRFHAAALPPAHVAIRHGVRLTTGARTVVDLARSLPRLEGVAVADSALHGRITTKKELRRMLADCAGWPGIDQARRVVEFSDELAESVLESAARVIFAQARLTPPRLQTDILDDAFRFIGRADFLWEEHQTIVEADGMEKYEDPERAREQIRRDIRLREAGYKVVHVTWAEVFGDPARVIARIRKAFAAPSPY
jgi:very-short-patch-repair endonuclease